MGLLLKIRNSICILLILIILVVVIYATVFIFKQNKEYSRLNQEYIVKEKTEEIVKEENRTGIEQIKPDKDNVNIGDDDIEFRSGNDIIIF